MKLTRVTKRSRTGEQTPTAPDATCRREAVVELAQVFDENGSAREQNHDAELTNLNAIDR